MYLTDKYYSKNANGKIIFWQGEVPTEYAVTIIRTGQLNGKIREITNQSNIGDGYDHRVKRLKAKAKLKEKKGYKRIGDFKDAQDLELTEGGKYHVSYDSRLEAYLDKMLTVNKTDANNILKPMKAVQFKPKKFKYPAIIQPKINGFRNTAMLVKDIPNDGNMFGTNKSNVKLLTKEGHEYVVPHIEIDMLGLLNMNTSIVFDGEIYMHNEILSNIKRRLPLRKIGSTTISNNSLPIDPLTFLIFDLSVPDISQLDRLKLKDELILQCRDIYYEPKSNRYLFSTGDTKYNSILNVRATIINSDEEAYKHLEAALASGFEGVILRELDAEYMFGGRRTNMMKLKKSMSGEFEILDIILKNKDSVRTYISFKCKNDINDKTFEVTPEGNEVDRQEFLNNKEHYIGLLMTCTYYERTVTDLPFHAVGRIREDWDMSIDDLNIEI